MDGRDEVGGAVAGDVFDKVWAAHVVGYGLAVDAPALESCGDTCNLVVALRVTVSDAYVNDCLGGTNLAVNVRLQPQALYLAFEAYGAQAVSFHIEVTAHHGLMLLLSLGGLDVYAQDAPPILLDLRGDAYLIVILIAIVAMRTALVERDDGSLPEGLTLYHGSK